ncbi:MAG: peptidase M22 [Ruminococcus sp.]|nr:peptidase M22 [Ruminococcus sp.]
MSKILGIDTSNYTTSAALLDTETMEIIQEKKLLPVKKGEKGIRQSDAVFHHTAQLPIIMEKLFYQCKDVHIDGIGVSFAPRLLNGSYMPCFTVGDSTASVLGTVMGIDPERTSHQVGHILAGLYSCNNLELLQGDSQFLAFHASGGTTDLLLCTPDKNNIVDIKEIGTSLDLKAGQAVDRTGIMLGLDFPCGKELDMLACKSSSKFKTKPVIRDGSCCLSGVENLCRKMYDNNESHEDIAKFCISFLCDTFKKMILSAFEKYGEMPLLCVGGVMSNTIIREEISKEFGALFAKPEFSCDNAVGTAVYCALKRGMI